jgi:hypothetical protein
MIADLSPAVRAAWRMGHAAEKLENLLRECRWEREHMTAEDLAAIEQLLNDSYNAHRKLCDELQPWLGEDPGAERRDVLAVLGG